MKKVIIGSFIAMIIAGSSIFTLNQVDSLRTSKIIATPIVNDESLVSGKISMRVENKAPMKSLDKEKQAEISANETSKVIDESSVLNISKIPKNLKAKTDRQIEAQMQSKSNEEKTNVAIDKVEVPKGIHIKNENPNFTFGQALQLYKNKFSVIDEEITDVTYDAKYKYYSFLLGGYAVQVYEDGQIKQE
ncbi:hypothetical protein [uncultured Clostridium sp.]|jgi:hypothetical protein|uniref:hypothetical protein n=1 Tax=uncultured Clostridium sp. TaxID=59620 RepID=UPI0026140C82|nr:hypothetical protein [uncultured Clostridium sp.]